jgi:hypothetical protein
MSINSGQKDTAKERDDEEEEKIDMRKSKLSF